LLKKQKSLIGMNILNLDILNLKNSDKMMVIDKLEEIKEIPVLFMWFIGFINTKFKQLIKHLKLLKTEKSKFLIFFNL
jgi:hypothetical protein